jgi:hypothetical protein
MSKAFAIPILSVIAGLLLLASAASAEDKALDWKVLQEAKISLEKGLAAAQQKGRPISAKFEVEDGALQLSIYTGSKGKFSEVIVDHKSGKITKTEEIKEGEDLTHATAQSKAMALAKISLRSAVAKALASNRGYRAVSAVPSLEDGKPVAAVVLENAKSTKTVSEKLN